MQEAIYYDDYMRAKHIIARPRAKVNACAEFDLASPLATMKPELEVEFGELGLETVERVAFLATVLTVVCCAFTTLVATLSIPAGMVTLLGMPVMTPSLSVMVV